MINPVDAGHGQDGFVMTSAMAAAAEGSPTTMGGLSIRALFERHYDFVWRAARRLGAPADIADDIAQETFLVAARRLADIRAGSERAFLFGTAYRLSSQRRRADSRRPVSTGSDVDRFASAIPSPGELLDQKHARELLDRILATLPWELRAVFVLFELEGLSMVEIAECTELAPGTVASRLRRAREAFQAEVRRVRARADGAKGAIR